MEVTEAKCSSGYGKPPWIFKGSALYQLHLVKAETARAFIPKEFRLVEAFGYTLGGFFLANYEDSPAGVFNELVVIAGIVWNPPTSCAWASRVLVSSKDACAHGRKDVGLPSQVAKFSKRIPVIPKQKQSKFSSFLNAVGLGTTLFGPKHRMDVQVTEINGPSVTDFCTISLETVDLYEWRSRHRDSYYSRFPSVKLDHWWKGPAIKMSLPSFSGRTEYNPNLLKYSCDIECRMTAVQPAKVSGPFLRPEDDMDESIGHRNCKEVDSNSKEFNDNQRNLSISIMLSKPVLALEFSCLKMQVEAPTEVSQSSKNSYTPSFRVS